MCAKAAHSTEWGSVSSQPSSTLTPHPPYQRAATNAVFSSLSSGICFSFCSIYSIKKYPLRPFLRERGPRRPWGATFGWAASGGNSAPQGLPGPRPRARPAARRGEQRVLPVRGARVRHRRSIRRPLQRRERKALAHGPSHRPRSPPRRRSLPSLSPLLALPPPSSPWPSRLSLSSPHTFFSPSLLLLTFSLFLLLLPFSSFSPLSPLSALPFLPIFLTPPLSHPLLCLFPFVSTIPLPGCLSLFSPLSLSFLSLPSGFPSLSNSE